jgi:hypothetical protein
MKINLKIPAFRAFGMCAKASAAALLLLGSVGMIQAQPSPVGTWDCTISGRNQGGIAFLDFGPSNTLTGFRLLSSLHPSRAGTSAVASIDRAPVIGRTDSTIGGSSGGGTTGNTNLVGSDTFTGNWTFDERGRVIGSFIEVVGAGVQNCTTNENISDVEGTTTIAHTNDDGSVSFFTTNVFILITNGVTITCTTNTGTTNGVSFIGRAVPGRRLTLVASTPNGKVTYRGIPFVTNLTDLSGDWFGTRVVSKDSALETFSLTASDFPNIYVSTVGSGPNYDLEAMAFISAHKKVGMVFAQGETNGTLSSFVAPLRTGKTGVLSVTGRGVELDTEAGTPFQYHAVRMLAPPAGP